MMDIVQNKRDGVGIRPPNPSHENEFSGANEDREKLVDR